MLPRVIAATSMGFKDQRRRPLLLILLVLVPTYVIANSIAITQATPRNFVLPGGDLVTTTMRDLHGAVMAGIAVAFVAGLGGVFVMQAALEGDRRLVAAGFRPVETVAPRLAVLMSDAALVVAVSLAVTAVFFTPSSWVTFAGAAMLNGLIYALLGALFGAVLDKLSATYLMLFLTMTDLGIVQNPMFGSGAPGSGDRLLPGYGPTRVMVDGAYSSQFAAFGDLWLSVGWVTALGVAVLLVLRRTVRAGDAA